MASFATRHPCGVSRRIGLISLVICAVLPAVSRAGGDYDDKDFAVRLAPAFLRFTEVSALGGQTAANRWSSAINPAAANWLEIPEKYGIVLAPYYSNVGFSDGMNVHVFGESLTWDSKKWGTFQPTISQIRITDGKTNQRMDFGYQVDTAQLQWAKRWGDFAFGANFNFAKAETRQYGVIVTPGVFPATTAINAEGNAESYRFRLGGLQKFADKFLAGLVLEYGFQPYRSDTLRVTTITLPVPPVVAVTKDRGT